MKTQFNFKRGQVIMMSYQPAGYTPDFTPYHITKLTKDGFYRNSGMRGSHSLFVAYNDLNKVNKHGIAILIK
jgi:hypothetical protein